MIDLPIISIAILLPLLSALYINLFISHSQSPKKQIYVMYVASLSSVLTLITAIAMLINFDFSKDGMQYEERYSWLDAIGLEYYVGIDGLSIYFIFLTALLTFICIIASMLTVKKFNKEFLLTFLLLEAFCIGAFSAQNLLLFYGFFEVILIPMYLIIGIWGGENRIYASFKFFLYTFFGSVFFLLAIIYIFIHAGTLNMHELNLALPVTSPETQYALFIATFIAFAVKVPMLPVHTWLPDAHVQAPTSGSVMLAGVLLKLGGYAILRISLPMLPLACKFFAPYIIIISSIAVVYASFVALAQTDMKKMIAYSSVAHMGYVTGGIFSFTINGVTGACFQMISHGLVSAALFLIVGMLYERGKTKNIYKYGGLASKMPIMATCFMVAMMGSVGLPGTSGFIGEFLTIIGIFEVMPIGAVLCALGVIFGAAYMLKLYKHVVFGKPSGNYIDKFSDLYFYEQCALWPLIFMIIAIGLYPSTVMMFLEQPVINLLKIY